MRSRAKKDSPLTLHHLITALATRIVLALLVGCWVGFAGAPAGAGLPDEGDCPRVTLDPDAKHTAEDAVAVAIEPGMIIGQENLLVLRKLIPKEVFRHRGVFFYEGMRMQVGACHRRFAVPGFYRDATQKFAGQAFVNQDGDLENYTAGLPFPQTQIDAHNDAAGVQWAFNLEQRYIGAGVRGKFRISDFPSSVGQMQEYDGNFFVLKAAHRADLPNQDFHIEGKPELDLAAGGAFQRPFNTRHLAWRQFRSKRASTRYKEPDDIFAYIPSMRKVRRAANSWVDGLYLPRFSSAGGGGGGQLAYGDAGAISPTAGRSIAISENIRRGLVGFTLRANAYVWRLLGEVDVLAPINSTGTGYPVEAVRNFGTSGLSLANDTWDVRRAVVLEGALRIPNTDVAFVTLYLDYQTLQPLYWISRTSQNRLLDVGVLAYKFSDDLINPPQWPGDAKASVFLPVAAAFFDAGAGRGGWRRESYDLDATPPGPDQQRAMTTSDSLGRGR